MTESEHQIVTILNNALIVEYSDICNWPCRVNRVADANAARLLSHLVADSVKHFETISGIIRELGGTPAWEFQPSLEQEETDIREIVRSQRDKERLAAMAYKTAAGMTDDHYISTVLTAMAAAEEVHLALCEKIISRLSPS